MNDVYKMFADAICEYDAKWSDAGVVRAFREQAPPNDFDRAVRAAITALYDYAVERGYDNAFVKINALNGNESR